MPFVLNRTTMQYLQVPDSSVYPVGQWIRDPDISALIDAGITPDYWRIQGDTVTEVTPGERAAIDARLAQDFVQSIRDRARGDLGGKGVTALIEVLLDEINNLRSSAGLPPRSIGQLRAAINSRIDA